MLDAAQAAGITTVVLKILPWTNGTNSQMQTRDDWNASLAALAAGYSNAVLVDASSYVGQYRASGSGGNLWDIQTAYNQDGVHFNQTGHGQIALAIAEAIGSSTTVSLVSSATESNYGQSVTFTATVAPGTPGADSPSGTVTFKDGTTTLGTATLSNGIATYSTSAFGVGSHSITAVYVGDTNYSASISAPVTQTVSSVQQTGGHRGRGTTLRSVLQGRRTIKSTTASPSPPVASPAPSRTTVPEVRSTARIKLMLDRVNQRRLKRLSRLQMTP